MDKGDRVMPQESICQQLAGIRCFLLDMETKQLCSEDCKGLCPICGKDLNSGACNCAQPKDQRFAVLQQLLDNDEVK